MDDNLLMQKRAERHLGREMQSTTSLDSSCAQSTKITKNRPKRKLLHLFLHSIRLFGVFAACLLLCASSSCEDPPLLHLRRLLAWEADRSWVIEAVLLREEERPPRLSLRLIELPEKKLDELPLDSALYRGFFSKAPSKDGERILRESRFHLLPALRQAARPWTHWKGKPLRWQWLSEQHQQGAPALSKAVFQWKPPRQGITLTTPQEGGRRWIARRVPLLGAVRRLDEKIKAHLGEDLWFVAWPAVGEKAAHWRLVWKGRYLRELSEMPSKIAEDAHLLLSCAQGWCLLQADTGRISKGEAQITQSFAWEMAPHLAFLVHLRGYQAHEKKRYDLALADFSLASRLDPHLTDARYNQACAHALRGESAQAMALLQPLLAKHPSYRKLACRDTDLLRLRKDPRYQRVFDCIPTSTLPISRPSPSSSTTKTP